MVDRVFGTGYVAVQLFFVLSGFILAYSYAGRVRPVRAGEFWTARFARIYPVYLLATLLALPTFLGRAAEFGYGPGGAALRALGSFALVQS